MSLPGVEAQSPLYAELALFRNDRAAWNQLAGPRIAAQMASRSLESNLAQLLRLPRDLQIIVWKHLAPDLREQMRPQLDSARRPAPQAA